MLFKIRKWIWRVLGIIKLGQQIEDSKILLAKMMHQSNLQKVESILQDINKAEFKVFSQWGDDGIIQFLVDYLEIENHTFIEFGVENYQEANTRFLLINNNWRGLIFDGSRQNILDIHADEIYWKYDLIAKNAFITRENINELILDNGFSGEIGILSIDIDGNDYWVWEAIEVVDPIVVIVEYNAVFGTDRLISVPYRADFNRTQAHYSNLYFGASLPALVELGITKGYHFIGCTSSGNNAYFIKKGYERDLNPLTAAEGFVNSKSRESRDRSGHLIFISGDSRLDQIKGLQVIDVRNGQHQHL